MLQYILEIWRKITTKDSPLHFWKDVSWSSAKQSICEAWVKAVVHHCVGIGNSIILCSRITLSYNGNICCRCLIIKPSRVQWSDVPPIFWHMTIWYFIISLGFLFVHQIFSQFILPKNASNPVCNHQPNCHRFYYIQEMPDKFPGQLSEEIKRTLDGYTHHGPHTPCYGSTWWELRSVNSDPRW